MTKNMEDCGFPARLRLELDGQGFGVQVVMWCVTELQ